MIALYHTCSQTLLLYVVAPLTTPECVEITVRIGSHTIGVLVQRSSFPPETFLRAMIR